MTKRIFCSGFSWKVVDAKWPAFEKAFLGFEPTQLIYQPNEFWDRLLTDSGIIRNGAKIFSVRHNATFVQEISRIHGGFGKFLAGWPFSDQIGLLQLLAKQGSRLGGNTGQMLLRFLGWDGFIRPRMWLLVYRVAG